MKELLRNKTAGIFVLTCFPIRMLPRDRHDGSEASQYLDKDRGAGVVVVVIRLLLLSLSTYSVDGGECSVFEKECISVDRQSVE